MLEPDRSFVRQLREIDKNLGVKFNGSNFVVTYKRAAGQPANIWLVKNESGGFRQPDRRDLEAIRRGNLDNESAETRIQKLSYYSEKIMEKQEKDAHDNIRHMTRDNKRQLERAFLQRTNQSKGNSAFRRVDLKRKGKTISEIKATANV